MTFNQLVKGNKHFKDIYFPKLEKRFEKLIKEGQHPEILFIGCSDSRVVPELIVDSKPGDMFILRNIGNFVPPYKNDEDYHGSSAAIAYAVSVLNVKHIIICGHSHCGACASLYKELEDDKSLLHVKTWLKLGDRAKKYAINKVGTSNKDKLLRTTEKISIIYQLENLLSYPEVYKKVKNKKLEVHGWYYQIEDGSIFYYCGKSNSFEKL